MAKNNEVKVSLAEAKRILKDASDQKSLIWEDLEIKVRPNLDMKDMRVFVQECINSCFTDDGDYMPDAEDFAIRINIIEKYTNLSMPSDLKIQYLLVYNTDIISRIVDLIDPAQFDVIRASIERGVRYRASAHIEGMTQKLNEIYATVLAIIDDFDTKFGEIFGAISADDMKLIMKGISEIGELDEGKIAKAYIESTRKDNAPETDAPPDTVE